MRIFNEAGMNLLKEFEQCRLKAYDDNGKAAGGVWTIGWGCTYYEDGTRVKEGDVITQERADELKMNLLNRDFVPVVDRLITSDVNCNQFAACVCFAYNVGTDVDADTKAEGFGDSTLLKKINANPNDPTIEAEFMKWISKGSVFEKGLRRRRTAEVALYKSQA